MKDPLPEIVIYTPQELQQSTYIRTGLFELERAGRLRCRLSFDLERRPGKVKVDDEGQVTWSNGRQNKTSYYTLIDPERSRKIHFAADLYDFANVYSGFALKHCQYVFKRNYQNRYVDPLPEEFRKKLIPLGLTFKVGTSAEYGWKRMLLALMLHNIRGTARWRSLFSGKTGKLLKSAYDHWLGAKRAVKVEAFNHIQEELSREIIFQTRCFPDVASSDIDEVQEERARLIRKLRDCFPDRFIGGFVPDALSRERYPDALTNMPTEQQAYLQMVKRAGIGIYSRGKEDSPAWKMAEYLALGKCIVAEAMNTELPVPLKEGKHLLYYRTVDECIDRCKEVIDDENLMRTLAKNARRYYEEQVHPARGVERIIRFMLEGEQVFSSPKR